MVPRQGHHRDLAESLARWKHSTGMTSGLSPAGNLCLTSCKAGSWLPPDKSTFHTWKVEVTQLFKAQSRKSASVLPLFFFFYAQIELQAWAWR